MPDIISEVALPSKGKIYSVPIQWENQLRAPRLKDRGLGDTTRVLQLQANILDKTLLKPLGISAYDLHTADFTYLNMRQRQLSKGNKPYYVSVKCNNCGKVHQVNVDFAKLEVKYLEEDKLDLSFTTLNDEELELNFITPRMLDDSKVRAQEYKDEYKEVEMTLDDLRTQELLRLVIRSVNGARLTDARMTEFIQNLYASDIADIFAKLEDFDFGVQFKQSFTCDSCGKKIVYTVPAG